MPHKLLLADDSVTIQRVIELTFADEDIQVIVVGDGRQAIERVQSERPDIVLADIGMPERDGYEVAAFIKGHPQLSNTPVLLLSGAFEPLDEERARSVGCDGVLAKPFEPQAVINRVRELLTARQNAMPQVTADQPVTAAVPAGLDLGASLAETGVPVAEKKPGSSIEDYFDRLDAAFANLGAPAAAAPRLEREPEDLRRELDDLAQPSAERPAAAAVAWDPEVVGELTPARQPILANAFATLLAAEEQGVDPAAALGLAAPPPPVSDAFIEDIVQRVVARLGDESMRRVVLDTAERLVREEIDRIKRTGATP